MSDPNDEKTGDDVTDLELPDDAAEDVVGGLKIDGVDGESTDDHGRHRGEID